MAPRVPAASTGSTASRGGPVVSGAVAGATTGRPAVRRMVTARFAAEYLSVTTRTLRSWTAAGLLDCLKVGRTVRFDLRQLEQFVVDHTVGGSR